MLAVSAVTLPRCLGLGLAGSVLIAAGGLTAGALPVEAPPAVGDPGGLAAAGLVGTYLGITLLVAAWLAVGWLLRGPEPPSVRALLSTMAVWASPLAVGAPLFSRDVYCYLAQGAMVGAGLDVYQAGPASLGGPLAAQVPTVWQQAPTPYGPVFLAIAAAVAKVTGSSVALGVLALRAVALAAVIVLVATMPRLAAMCGVPPAVAVWLGALNPLVLLHLIAGAHNDAVLLALLATGLAAAATRRYLTATTLVTLAALVKVPAVVGLAVVAALWADGPPGRARLLRSGLATAAVAVAVTAGVTWASGTGYGWLSALGTPVAAHSWSLSSAFGRVIGQVLEAAGADLAGYAVPAWRWLGVAAAGLCVAYLWLHHRRLGAVQALGLSLAAIALLGPSTRPWYALWALVPLAVAAPAGMVRRCAVLGTVVLAFLVLPTGYGPAGRELALASMGTGLGVVVATLAGVVAALPRAAGVGASPVSGSAAR